MSWEDDENPVNINLNGFMLRVIDKVEELSRENGRLNEQITALKLQYHEEELLRQGKLNAIELTKSLKEKEK